MNTFEFHVTVSNSVSKLGKFIGCLNLPAGITCNPEAPCFKKCYARRGRFCFTTVHNSLMRNLTSYYADPKRFFSVISAESGTYKYFRWFSSGDIVDPAFFNGMIRVAKANPDTKYLCFTKQYKIVNDYADHHRIPKNLNVVFSTWGSWIPDNPHKFPMSYVEFKKDTEGVNANIPSKAHECSGYCGECAKTAGSCWNLKKGECVRFHEH